MRETDEEIRYLDDSVEREQGDVGENQNAETSAIPINKNGTHANAYRARHNTEPDRKRTRRANATQKKKGHDQHAELYTPTSVRRKEERERKEDEVAVCRCHIVMHTINMEAPRVR